MMNSKKLLGLITVFLIVGSCLVPSISASFFKDRNAVFNTTINKRIEALTGDGKTNYYAIIATCGRYADSGANLPIGFAQQRYLYMSLLLAPNWKAKNIIFLVNQEATRANLLAAIDEMAGKVDNDDVFLFAWQGHGSQVKDDDGDERTFLKPFDTKDEVICPYDCHREGGNLVNFIRDDTLDREFSRIKSKGMCLIFESCFSGGLVKKDETDIDTDKNGFIDTDEATNFSEDFSYDLKTKQTLDLEKKNRIVIMASLDDTSARLAPLLGGPLTTGMALGFLGQYRGTKKDTNNNGFLSVEESFKWARSRMFGMTSAYYLGMWNAFIAINYFSQNHSKHDHPLIDAIVNGSRTFFTEIIMINLFLRITHGSWAVTIANMNDLYAEESGLDIIQLKTVQEEEVFSQLTLPTDSLFNHNPTVDDWNEVFHYLKTNTSFDEWSDDQISEWMPPLSDFIMVSWDDVHPSFQPGFFAEIEDTYTGKKDQELSFSASILGGSPPYSIVWDFGDGSYGGGLTPSHVFTSKGEYTISLSVIDSRGKTAVDLYTTDHIPLTTVQIIGNKNGYAENHFFDLDKDNSVLSFFIDTFLQHLASKC